MKRVWSMPAKVLGGLVVTALYALPQNYTVSAKPGVINYVEGEASVNGVPVQSKSTRGKASLGANDVLSTGDGKAEVLLTPGVFLRLGANSQIKMVSPSLTSTQVEVTKGDAMVEVAELLKENDIQILDHGAVVQIKKVGLYRFTADNPATAQTLEGKAEVSENGKTIGVGKKHEVVLGDVLKEQHVEDHPEHSDLYAWSKVRDEYVSAASYSSARNVMDAPGGGWGWGSSSFYGSGFYGAGFGPGWAWNPFWDSYAWLPGAGAFYSPFGFGYYAPALIAYAPVVVTPVNGKPVTVPVNPTKPGTGASIPVRTPAVSVVSAGARPVLSSQRANAGGSGAAPHASAGSSISHSSVSMSRGSVGGGGSHR